MYQVITNSVYIIILLCLGIDNIFVDISNELVLVDTSLPSSTVQHLLESTGKLVVFRGFGSMRSDTTASHHGAAVAIMKGRGYTSGLARLVQVHLLLFLIRCNHY